MSETTQLPIAISSILSPTKTHTKITIIVPHSVAVLAVAITAFLSIIIAAHGPVIGNLGWRLSGSDSKVGSGVKGDVDGRRLVIHAHRGGAGMRAESTLYALAYGIDIGADAIEMDTLFTKDGIPVVWHDFKIEPDKCTETIPNSGYVGKYINELALAELKTLECGSQQSEKMTQAQTYPNAQIQTLDEVLAFIKCYDKAGKVDINLETKIDFREPTITWPVSKYLTDLIPVFEKHGMVDRLIIQSFDWRTLVIKTHHPALRTTANIDETLLPFYGPDWLTTALLTNATTISPNHGSPNGNGDWAWTVNTPGYVAMTTREVVERAHAAGVRVMPWTVDDETTVVKVIRDGVDGIISNYPQRVAFLASALGLSHGLLQHWTHPREQKRLEEFNACVKRVGGMGLASEVNRISGIAEV
ncbi:PLC-like phosphodiesterase [Ascodesmis nigricans]|uniref:PLC-like phosphodiesterase n=1 Tax=Ascodesmis nigricans TaxID=341454 RepID=A0A4S2MUS6_9PEZI|nr:PLC-like phosphodiesterase [Ascodesmis nigricans]